MERQTSKSNFTHVSGVQFAAAIFANFISRFGCVHMSDFVTPNIRSATAIFFFLALRGEIYVTLVNCQCIL